MLIEPAGFCPFTDTLTANIILSKLKLYKTNLIETQLDGQAMKSDLATGCMPTINEDEHHSQA